MEYTMDVTDSPEPHDERVEQDGVRLAIAPAATMFLIGTEIDYQDRPARIRLFLLQSQCGGKLRLRRVCEICRRAQQSER